MVGRRRAEEADVAALRLHVGAVQREVRRQAAALRALAGAPLPPTEEARMRIGRRAVLAANGQTEASLEELVRLNARFLEGQRARKELELANAEGGAAGSHWEPHGDGEEAPDWAEVLMLAPR